MPVPVVVNDALEPFTSKPIDPSWNVRTVPPLSVTLAPPPSERTAGALVPMVVINAPFNVTDPPVSASTAGVPAAEVVNEIGTFVPIITPPPDACPAIRPLVVVT